MEYTLFLKRLGLEGARPSVLAKLFGQHVNTACNWRMRGSVPAKYVAEAFERGLFKPKAG